MEFNGNLYLFSILLGIVAYLIGVVYLSRKQQSIIGLALPVLFFVIAVYNLLKPLIIPNPYPTMQEGIYMTFFGILSIIGFAIFAIIKFVKRMESQKQK